MLRPKSLYFRGGKLQRFKAYLLDLPYPVKRALAISLDASLCVLSLPIAWFLRLGEAPRFDSASLIPTVAAIVLAPPLMAMLGNYRIVFRYGGWSMLAAIGGAMAIYCLPYTAIFLVVGVEGVPRTLGILQPLVLFFMIACSRLAVRLLLAENENSRHATNTRMRILIYGAGEAGRQLRAALSGVRHHKIVGFIDDSASLAGGRMLEGVHVYHSDRLPELQAKLEATDLILAMPSISRSRRAAIVENVAKLPIRVRTLPGISELVNGTFTMSDLRELDITDLLGREAVPPNALLLLRNVRDLCILVSGAGGSIGSEICRQVLSIGPSRLILVDQSEFALYKVHQELSVRMEQYQLGPIEIVPALASVCDKRRMDELLARWKPDTIYHAAAYKHVPLIEENCLEGIRNNVFGTLTCFRAAERHGVKNFVLVSTDKAVRPTNVMGASKRLAEQVLQALSARADICVSIVRFGNVLGSSGSVVPLFRRQIKQGGPVTITHAEVIRYFMTIPEAAQLVIQAGALASGGEVFVLDMGQPVRIADLARKMIELSGLSVRSPENPDGDIEIVVTGLRKGEKLYEELLIGHSPERTIHPRIMTARETYLAWDKLIICLDALEYHIQASEEQQAVALLWQCIAQDHDVRAIASALA